MASVTIDIQARVAGYQESIKTLQAEFAKLDPGSAMGKSIARAIKQAQQQVDALNKNMLPKASNDTQIDNIMEKVNRAGDAIKNVVSMMQDLSVGDLNFDALGNDIKTITSQIDLFQKQIDTNLNSGIKEAINNSESLKNVFTELGVDIKTITTESGSKALARGLADANNEAIRATQAFNTAANEVTRLQTRLDGIKNAKVFQDSNFSIEQVLGDLSKFSDPSKIINPQLLEELKNRIITNISSLNLNNESLVQNKISEIFGKINPNTTLAEFKARWEELKNALKEYVKSSKLDEVMTSGGNGTGVYNSLLGIDESSVAEAQSRLRTLLSSFQSVFSTNQWFDINKLIDQNALKDAAEMGKKLIANAFDAFIAEETKGKAALEEASGKKAVAEATMNAATEKAGKIEAANTEYKVRVESLEKTISELRAKVESLEAALHGKVGGALAGVKSNASGAGENVESYKFMVKDAQAYKSELESIAAKEQALGKVQGVISRWFSIYAVVRTVGNAIRNIISTVQELDKTITEISIVTDMSQNDLWGQMDQYTKLADKYAASISGVYQVSQLYYQQGLQQNDVMALTEQTLKMARISGLDYSDATNYMTNAIRSFKMEMTDAQTIVDVYSAIAATSATSTAELAQAMSKTASSAQAVGSSFEATTAMMAVMIEATREAPENIGSAMKSIISRYGELKQNVSGIDAEGEEYSLNKVDKALQSVGISIHNNVGEFREFDDVIFELAKKWDQIDVNAQRYIATIMAGNRQQSRFLALVSSYDRLQEEYDIAMNSEDASQLQYLKTLEGAEGKLQRLQNSLQSMYLDTGIDKFYKGLLDYGKSVIDTFAQMPDLMGLPIPALGKLASNFTSLALLITTLFKTIKTAFQTQRSELLVVGKIANTQELNDEESKLAAKLAMNRKYGVEIKQEKQRQAEEQQAIEYGITNPKKMGLLGKLNASKIAKGGGMIATAGGLALSAISAGIDVNTNKAAKGWTSIAGSALSAAGTFLMMPNALGAVLAIIQVISGAIEAWDIFIEDDAEKLERLQKTAEENNNEYLKKKDSTKTLKQEVEELEKLEKQSHLSADARKKYQEASDKFAEAHPDLISRYDEENHAIIDLAAAYSALAEAMHETAEAGKEAAASDVEYWQEKYNQAEKKYKETTRPNTIQSQFKQRGLNQVLSQDVYDTQFLSSDLYINLIKNGVPNQDLDITEDYGLMHLWNIVGDAARGIPIQQGSIDQVINNFDAMNELINKIKPSIDSPNLVRQIEEIQEAAQIIYDNYNSEILDYDLRSSSRQLMSATRSNLLKHTQSVNQDKMVKDNGITLNRESLFNLYTAAEGIINNYMTQAFINFSKDYEGENLYQDYINTQFKTDYESFYNNLLDWVTAASSFKEDELTKLLPNAKFYNEDNFRTALKDLGITEDLANQLIEIYFNDETFKVEDLTQWLGKEGYNGIEQISGVIQNFGENQLRSIQKAYSNFKELESQGAISSANDSFEEYIKLWDQLKDLPLAAQNILANWTDYSYFGLLNLVQSLQDLGIKDIKFEDLAKFANLLPSNIEIAVDNYIKNLSTEVTKYSDTLSKASSGMKFDEAIKFAEEMGLQLSDLSLSNGKYYYKEYGQIGDKLTEKFEADREAIEERIKQYEKLFNIFGQTGQYETKTQQIGIETIASGSSPIKLIENRQEREKLKLLYKAYTNSDNYEDGFLGFYNYLDELEKTSGTTLPRFGENSHYFVEQLKQLNKENYENVFNAQYNPVEKIPIYKNYEALIGYLTDEQNIIDTLIQDSDFKQSENRDKYLQSVKNITDAADRTSILDIYNTYATAYEQLSEDQKKDKTFSQYVAEQLQIDLDNLKEAQDYFNNLVKTQQISAGQFDKAGIKLEWDQIRAGNFESIDEQYRSAVISHLEDTNKFYSDLFETYGSKSGKEITVSDVNQYLIDAFGFKTFEDGGITKAYIDWEISNIKNLSDIISQINIDGNLNTEEKNNFIAQAKQIFSSQKSNTFNSLKNILSNYREVTDDMIKELANSLNKPIDELMKYFVGNGNGTYTADISSLITDIENGNIAVSDAIIEMLSGSVESTVEGYLKGIEQAVENSTKEGNYSEIVGMAAGIFSNLSETEKTSLGIESIDDLYEYSKELKAWSLSEKGKNIQISKEKDALIEYASIQAEFIDYLSQQDYGENWERISEEQYLSWLNKHNIADGDYGLREIWQQWTPENDLKLREGLNKKIQQINKDYSNIIFSNIAGFDFESIIKGTANREQSISNLRTYLEQAGVDPQKLVPEAMEVIYTSIAKNMPDMEGGWNSLFEEGSQYRFENLFNLAQIRQFAKDDYEQYEQAFNEAKDKKIDAWSEGTYALYTELKEDKSGYSIDQFLQDINRGMSSSGLDTLKAKNERNKVLRTRSGIGQEAAFYNMIKSGSFTEDDLLSYFETYFPDKDISQYYDFDKHKFKGSVATQWKFNSQTGELSLDKNYANTASLIGDTLSKTAQLLGTTFDETTQEAKESIKSIVQDNTDKLNEVDVNQILAKDIQTFTSETNRWQYGLNHFPEEVQTAIKGIDSGIKIAGDNIYVATEKGRQALINVLNENKDSFEEKSPEAAKEIENAYRDMTTKYDLAASVQKLLEGSVDFETASIIAFIMAEAETQEAINSYMETLGYKWSQTSGTYKHLGEEFTEIDRIVAEEIPDRYAGDTKLINEIKDSATNMHNNADKMIQQYKALDDIIANREEVTVDQIGALANSLGIDVDIVKDAWFSEQGRTPDTRRFNFNKFKNEVKDQSVSWQSDVLEKLQPRIASITNDIISSVSSAADDAFKGTNDHERMETFKKEFTRLFGEEEAKDLYSVDPITGAWKLSLEKFNKYKQEKIAELQLNGDAAATHDIDEATKKVAAQAVDISGFISADRRGENSVAYAKFKTELENYYSQIGTALSPEQLSEKIAMFEQGGAGAVEEAINIAKVAGVDLSNDDIQAIYAPAINRLVEYREALAELTVGSYIASDDLRGILQTIPGMVNADGIVTSVDNLAAAHLAIYQKMVDTADGAAATLQQENDTYAKYLNAAQQNETDAIATLGSAMGMTFDEFSNLLTRNGKKLKATMDAADTYGIEQLGNGKIRINKFTDFAKYMGWDASSEEYLSAFKSYNDSLIELNHKTEKSIMDEVKGITSAQGGDWLNLTYFSNALSKQVTETVTDFGVRGREQIPIRTALDDLNSVLIAYGAQIEGDILKIGEDANILGIAQAIGDSASTAGIELTSDLAELQDAIQQVLKSYIDAIVNGINGGLDNTGKNSLIAKARNLGVTDLQFEKTAEGFQLAQKSAIQLYNAVKNVDSLQGKIVFDKLSESLQKNNENFATTSALLNHIVSLRSQLNAVDSNVSGARRAEYEAELAVAQQIAAVRSTQEDSTWNFMSNKIPGAQNNPLNWAKNWTQALNKIRDAYKVKKGTESGFIDYTDFYNIVTEINNMAGAMGKTISLGKDIEGKAFELDGSLEAAANLIQRGARALTAVDSGDVMVNLGSLGISLANGASSMEAGITEGVESIANSQVEALDGLIAMLELIVAMEQLGDITGEDTTIDLGDIFAVANEGEATDNIEKMNGFTKKFKESRARLVEYLEGNDDAKKIFESTKVKIGENMRSMYDMMSLDYTELFGNLTGQQKEQAVKAYQSLLNGLYQAAISGNYDLNNIAGSLQEILNAQDYKFDESFTLDVGDVTFVVQNGVVVKAADWSDKQTKDVLAKYKAIYGSDDKAKTEILKAIQGYLNGQGGGTINVEDIIRVRHTTLIKKDEKGEYIISSKDGKTRYYKGSPDDNGFEAMLAKTTLEDQQGISGQDIKIDIEKGTAATTVTYGVKSKLQEKFKVTADSNGKVEWSDGNGNTGATQQELLENIFRKEKDFKENVEIDSKEFSSWVYTKYGVHLKITPEVIKDGDTVEDPTKDPAVRRTIEDAIKNKTWEINDLKNGTIEVKLPGGIVVKLNKEDVTIDGKTIDDQLMAEQLGLVLGKDINLGETITTSIQTAFTELPDITFNADTEAALAKVNELKEAAKEINSDLKLGANEIDSTLTQNQSNAIVRAAVQSIKVGTNEIPTKIDSNIVYAQTHPASQDIKTGGESGGGSAKGNVALAAGTLMGELGPELWVSGGRYFVAGQNGAEFVNLPSDAIVFNHQQTASLLKNGRAGRGKPITNETNAISYAKGNVNGGPAMASASAALAALKQLRSQWQALSQLSAKDLAGAGGGGGGGGGGNKAFLKELEKWYNWLQEIARLEYDINRYEAERNTIQSAWVKNGREYFNSQLKTLDALKQQLAVQADLVSSQTAYFNQRRKELNTNNGPFSSLYTFDDYGQLKYKNGKLEQLSNMVGSDKYNKPNLSPKEQYDYIVNTLGIDKKYLMYDTSGNEIKFKNGKPEDDAAYTSAIQAFWDKIDKDKEEMQNLFDSTEEGRKKMEELQQAQNEILQEMRDNQMDVEQKVYDAIVDMRERFIEKLEDTRDAIEDSNNKFIEGLNKALTKERDMYDNAENQKELDRLIRQRDILVRSGGSAAEIADLNEQIEDMQMDAYFDKQQEQIDAIQEASDKQIEKLEAQIKLETELLDYQKKYGLLWGQVTEIMSKSPEEIAKFIAENDSEYWNKSPIATQQAMNELRFVSEQWASYRDNGGLESDLTAIKNALTKNDTDNGDKDKKTKTDTGGKNPGGGGGKNPGGNNGTKTNDSDEWENDGAPSVWKSTTTDHWREQKKKNKKTGATKIEIVDKGKHNWEMYDNISGTKRCNICSRLSNSTANDDAPKQHGQRYVVTGTGPDNKFYQSGQFGSYDAAKAYANKLGDKYNVSIQPASTQKNNNEATAESTSLNSIADTLGLKSDTPTVLSQLKSQFLSKTVKTALDTSVFDGLSSAAMSVASNDNSNAVTIDQVDINLNVDKLANDYDSRQAARTIKDEILKIASKTSANNSVRR